MLMEEVWPGNKPSIDEGIGQQLGRLAMIGALGAGSLAGGYGVAGLTGSGKGGAQATPAPFISSVATDDRNTRDGYDLRAIAPSVPAQRAQTPSSRAVVAGGAPHSALPPELNGQPTASRAELIKNFSTVMTPLINQANQAIRNERNELLRIRSLRSIESQDAAKLNALAARYNVPTNETNGSRRQSASIISDLLLRVDTIPVNLALSQAALETRWGSDDLFRQGLNAFGQKATNRHQQHQVIRNTDRLNYRAYDNLLHSVQSYMHNLNTHNAYAEFRTKRSSLRRQSNMNPDLMGRELTRYLHGYSTNPEYGNRLVQVMATARSVRETA